MLVGVSVGVCVGVWVKVGVGGTGVFVGVSVGVNVGVFVKVGVGVKVWVGVFVGVLVGVCVKVCVGVGVGVGVGSPPASTTKPHRGIEDAGLDADTEAISRRSPPLKLSVFVVSLPVVAAPLITTDILPAAEFFRLVSVY